MLYSITEGIVSWIDGLSINDLPHPFPVSITVHSKMGMLGLEAQGIAGSIPLLDGSTLHIHPKVGQVNFLRMLFLAEGFQPDLQREYDSFVDLYVDEDEGLNVMVARQLMICAAEIMSRSPMTARVVRKRRGTFAAGELDAVATALNIATKRLDPVIFTIKERTLNMPENTVISEALVRAMQVLSSNDANTYSSVYAKWLGRFPRSRNIVGDIEAIEAGFAAEKYGGSRDYYRKALMLSRIILGSFGLGLGEGTTERGDAVLLNTADVFERYLRNVIARSYASAGYIVSKGGGSTMCLYTDGSFEIEPDIVIIKDGKIVLIADAKYKKPTSGDHYQMNAYLGVTDASSGVLLAPSYSSSNVSVRDFSTGKGRYVREAYLPLTDFKATEEFLAELVQRFG